MFPITNFSPVEAQKQILGADRARAAYQTLESPSLDYAAQANGLVQSQETRVPGKVQVLQNSQKLQEAWLGIVGNAGPQTRPLYTQVENERVAVAHPSLSPLVRVKGNEVQGDPNVTNAFVTANQVDEMASEHLGRDIRYRSQDGRLNIRLADGDGGPHHTRTSGIITLPNNGGLTSGDDADVIAHEQGHAILDAQRPELRPGHVNEAMNEAFGDTTAMFHAFQSKEVRADTIKRWEAGDRSGLVARIGEGGAINLIPGNTDPTAGFRDLSKAPPTEPDAEIPDGHIASVKFSSAMYSNVQDVYDKIRQRNPGLSKDDALSLAAERVGSDFFRATDLMKPGSQLTQSDLAQGVMRANGVDQKGGLHQIYQRNFEQAGLTPVTTESTVHQAGLSALSSKLQLPAGLKTAQEFDALGGQQSKEGALVAQDLLAQNRTTLGVPGSVDMNPTKLYHNERGETFVSYSGFAKNGGGEEFLRLGFDAQGKLLQADSVHEAAEPQAPFSFPGGFPGGFPGASPAGFPGGFPNLVPTAPTASFPPGLSGSGDAQPPRPPVWNAA